MDCEIKSNPFQKGGRTKRRKRNERKRRRGKRKAEKEFNEKVM